VRARGLMRGPKRSGITMTTAGDVGVRWPTIGSVE
jgi:hypothetical protein